MKKVAIYDPAPRTCGPSAWCQHVKAGFIELGWEAKIVAGTKSGKPTKLWGLERYQEKDNVEATIRGCSAWSEMPDIVCRHEQVPMHLNAADLAIVAELRCPPVDKEAEKNGDVPTYVKVLRRTVKPWTTYFHGPLIATYPYLEQALNAGKFSGYVAGLHEKAIALGGKLIDSVEADVIFLPYAAKYEIGKKVKARKRLGMMGRVDEVKGQHVVALMADKLPEGWNVELWGAMSLGLGPRKTYLIAQGLRRHKYNVRFFPPERFEKGIDTVLYHDEEGKKAKPALVTYPWRAWKGESEDNPDRTVSYKGSYPASGATKIARRLGIMPAITSSHFAAWAEFTVLEAMDAGVIVVGPDHLVREYAKMRLDLWRTMPKPRKEWSKLKMSDEEKLAHRELRQQIVAATELIGTAKHQEMADYNRKRLRELHSPKKFAEQMAEGALNGGGRK